MVLQDAWDAAQQLLNEKVRPAHRVEIAIAHVVDRPAAWAFTYQSTKFLEEGDIVSSLLGNGPVVVAKDGRPLFLAGTAEPLADQLTRCDGVRGRAS